MLKHSFSHVTTWVFDLDHTLYPPHKQLFDQISDRMTRFMVRELGLSEPHASQLRHDYWSRYGTTLAGLMRHHDIDPDPFLLDVHEISFDVLEPDAELAALIAALPGRCIIYTNGTVPYAQNVLAARGLAGKFDAIYGIENAGYIPKPEATAFDKIFAQDGLSPQTAAMFEDDPRNLKAPFHLGMRTIHVAPEPKTADHIHHHTDDLNAFLAQLT